MSDETWPAQFHRLDVLVFDDEDVGVEQIKTMLGNVRYISASVIAAKTIGVEFNDDHPLNRRNLTVADVDEYFDRNNDTRDAERYRKLRALHHEDGGLVVTLVKNVRLGSDCPSGDRLDEMIDELDPAQASG
jgi:hypothetical protein